MNQSWSKILTTSSFVLRFSRGIYTGNVTLRGAAAHAMLIEPSRGLAGAIKTRDHLPIHVHHLASRIDPEAGAGVVNHRRCPRSIERRRLNLVLRRRLAEIDVLARIHE